ncbi:MAG: CoA transferase [Clostridiales Family XIII bacterium]|nr:CoA transferase [Clostridiales Family XIII bacterium]
MANALSKFRVIDLTHMLAGSFCTKILADLGADVIKIERPDTGDDSRMIGPFVNGESMYFIEQNRNKRSVVLDLKTEDGRGALLKLVKNADVLVENFRPGVMEKLGLGYDTLETLNPALIYASGTGFGQEGPMRDEAAYDLTVQAFSGMMGVTGKAGGEYSKVGSSVVSTSAGTLLAAGIIAALFERFTSGLGQKIDVSMYGAASAIMENPMMRYLNAGIEARPLGNRHAGACPFSSFHTSNGDIVIATTTDAAWVKLCEALVHTELTVDPRFITTDDRSENWTTLESVLNEILKKETQEEWILKLRAHNVVCGKINTVANLLEDPQIADRKMILDTEHPIAGMVSVTGMPIKLSRTPCEIRRSAPLLGENTDEILYDSAKTHF